MSSPISDEVADAILGRAHAESEAGQRHREEVLPTALLCLVFPTAPEMLRARVTRDDILRGTAGLASDCAIDDAMDRLRVARATPDD